MAARGFLLYILFVCVVGHAQVSIDYDIVYVKQPRFGDDINTIWPEVFHPARLEPGADLVLLHPDGSEDILFDAGDIGAVTDPFVSFDGQWIYFSYFPDLQNLNSQRNNLPIQGADIFRIQAQAPHALEQLTFGEFTPNTGAGIWDESNPINPPSTFNRLGYGILNLGPSPLPGGKIAFTSSRNALLPTKGFTYPTLQLFVMDEDGSNVTAIAPMTVGSALHPTIMQDGRIMFSTYESQGLRDRRLWGIWSIYPDGRHWAPIVSAMKAPEAFHFMTQLGDGDLIVEAYYNLNNNGFGALFRMPVQPPSGTAPFHSAFLADNPPIDQTSSSGNVGTFRMPFTPWGMTAVTPMTHKNDDAAPIGADGITRVGKFTHPSAAPGNHLLVAWTPGPANDLNRPTPLPRYDSGLYLLPNADPVWAPQNLQLIKNDPAFNEAWPRAVVPYSAVHGIAEPAEIPWLPNDGSVHAALPAGTPYGLVGTSSFYKRESFPGQGNANFDGLDPLNTSQNGASTNWASQGAEAGKYHDADIWAVRILSMEPNTHRSYGPNNVGTHGFPFTSFANERLRILGEIPLRKFDAQNNPVLDPEGNPDTSFLAKIPADTPFTFQTIDRDGLVLNMAQTWHQVRPGEMRADCGGCHAHSQQPLSFDQTAAAQTGYQVVDLTATTPLISTDGTGQPDVAVIDQPVVNVEFYRDIRPILQNRCVDACHTAANPAPAGNLVLDDLSLYGGLPGDYKRLADDQDANWGYPPVINNGIWRQTNASRYIRMFQSRRSLLIWKIFGRRLDGWSNADHPTETVPGDQSTLPTGANPNDADLDYNGTIMPPPGTTQALTEDEKMLFARWVDLGAPINQGAGNNDNGPWGWFLDDLRPTVTISMPRPGFNNAPITSLRFGMADAYKGLNMSSLSVTTDFVVQGRPPGAELADLVTATGNGIYTINLNSPITSMATGLMRIDVADNEGNITRVRQQFSNLGAETVFINGFESATADGVLGGAHTR